MKKIITYFANQSLFVNLVTIGILLAGVMYLSNAKREAFPEIDFNYVIVTTVYPGAIAEDVEKHVTLSIEDELRELDGIEELKSNSIEGMSIVVIKLDPDLDNKDKSVSDITSAIDRIDDFPEDVQKPGVIELNTRQQPVLDICLINKNDIRDDKDEFELRKYAKILEDRILDIDGVARVNKMGYRDREMIVEVNPKLLDEYHIGMNEIVMALSNKNLNFPGGIINDRNEEILIRTIGEVENSNDISNILIRANDMGNWVRIGDVAKVKDSFEEEKIINKTIGKRSITLTVLKKESADIIDLVDLTNQELERYKKVIPKNYELIITNDLSYYVKNRLNVLINNGIIGFVLVVLLLLLTLGWRISLVTALGLPLAFTGTFIWMGYSDVSINLMSMFGLILALGMLVDDAIIVAENIYRHLEDGEGVKEAVINGASEVVAPVAGTILTTISAFAPLMYMTGIMGKFMWTLPAVVSVALVSSWVESMFILPSHVMDVEKRSKSSEFKDENTRWVILPFFKKRYVRVLESILKHRYIVLLVVVVIFLGSLAFAALNVKFILFPAGGIEIFVVKAEAPSGTSVREMSKKLSLIEKIISQLPEEELDSFTSRAGIMQEEPNDPYTKRGSKYGIIIVYLTSAQKREKKADEIMNSIREKCSSLKGFEKLEFKYVRHGPPTSMPVSIALKGDNFSVLAEMAEEYKKYLLKIEGLKDIKDNFEKDKEELRIFVKEKTAALTGISVLDIATTVRSCYEGVVATSIKKSSEEIDIRVIFPRRLREDINSIKKIQIANRKGNLIPLASIARFERGRGISIIGRKDWRRTITVTADIDERAKDVTSVTVNRMLKKHFSDIEDRYPGYLVSYEGEFKDTEESMESLSTSFMIAAMVIYIILTALFRSLIHPIIIMGVIPLTLIGVIWTFYFHGLPLSFLAIMGVVGLTGVVVNDSIIYIDFINKARDRGMSAYNATIEAGARRLRPIFLTSATTFFGLVPTAYGLGGNDPFLKPMAMSMSWGILFGTLITLIVTPALYNIVNDIRSKFMKNNRAQ